MPDANPVERKLLGYVVVDGGTLLIGDPTYALPWKAERRPGTDYAAVIAAPVAHAQPLADQPVLLLGRFGGDGVFPVFGEFEEGFFVRATIEFVDPEDDDGSEEG